jgi:hypothetical protein
VGPRAGLDGCEKSRPNGIRSADSAARSESLHLLMVAALTTGVQNTARSFLDYARRKTGGT